MSELKIVLVVALSLHVLLIFSMCRVSARAETAMRARKRLRQSLLNRGGK